MNRLTIIGNLTRDPENRTTQSGKEVCSFTVAVNRRQRRADGSNEADFFRVSAWGELGKSCQQYLVKGRKVAVIGPVSVNTYQGQDGTTRASLEVIAQDVEFLSSRQGEGGSGTASSGTAAPAAAPDAAPAATAVNLPDDELPF